jgi:quercetin dioxygenase-like cupin family protein
MEQEGRQTNAKALVGQVIKSKDLLDYQEGAVVSRAIMDRKTGSVTLFAFDESEGLSEHTAPFDGLVQLVEGEMAIFLSGKAHRVGPGEMLIMPAHEPHSLRALKPSKMFLVMIRS